MAPPQVAALGRGLAGVYSPRRPLGWGGDQATPTSPPGSCFSPGAPRSGSGHTCPHPTGLQGRFRGGPGQRSVVGMHGQAQGMRERAHVCTHVHGYTHTHTDAHTRTNTQTQRRTCGQMHTYAAGTHVHARAYKHVCRWIVYVHTYIQVHTCTLRGGQWTHTHTLKGGETEGFGIQGPPPPTKNTGDPTIMSRPPNPRRARPKSCHGAGSAADRRNGLSISPFPAPIGR